jgi:hypothetical protein
MKVDFKITTWETVKVPQDMEAEVLSKLESGEITTANDLCELLDCSSEKIHDVDEQMTPEENGGNSTIEVQDGGEYIFHNGNL